MRLLRKVCVALTVFWIGARAIAQAGFDSPYYAEAIVTHGVSSGTKIDANDPRPLLQAAWRLGQEYGWIIDYEDPIYGAGDITSRGGRHLVRGGRFTSTVDVSPNSSDHDRDATFQQMIEQYRQSGNPGSFVTRRSAAGRTDISGVQAGGEPPILDTEITLPSKLRSAEDTLSAIYTMAAAKRGVKIIRGGIFDNGLNLARVSVGGDKIAARILMAQVLAQLSPRMWIMNWDPDTKVYHINFLPATVISKDSSGRRVIRQIGARQIDTVPAGTH
jgi:hypothetical protein